MTLWITVFVIVLAGVQTVLFNLSISLGMTFKQLQFPLKNNNLKVRKKCNQTSNLNLGSYGANMSGELQNSNPLVAEAWLKLQREERTLAKFRLRMLQCGHPNAI